MKGLRETKLKKKKITNRKKESIHNNKKHFKNIHKDKKIFPDISERGDEQAKNMKIKRNKRQRMRKENLK